MSKSIEIIRTELEENGYSIIPNILTKEEIEKGKGMFYEWKKEVSDTIHAQINPHGIYKYHEVGHQRHAWYIRTNPKVQKVFKELWKTD